MTSSRLNMAAAVLALGALMTVTAPAHAASGDRAWVWPLQPIPRVVAGFAPPDDVWHAGHRGVDLLGPGGQPVLAIGAGRVTFAGPLAGRGVVVVDHGELRSTYEPVLAQVSVGQRVQAGQPLGPLQSVRSHCPPQTCLHLGVRSGETYLDPLDLLPDREVRLKPLDGELWPVAATGGSAVTPETSGPPAAHRDTGAATELSARAVLGGAAVTAALLVTGRRRKPQARG